MGKKLSGIFWGVILIASGGIALAQTQGYLNNVKPGIWIGVFAGISILSLMLYFISGIRNWGMLFPAGIFGGLAFLLAMEVNNVDNPAMAAPLFFGIGAPFVVAYFLDRSKNWWALIPAGVMAFVAFVLLVVENMGGEVIGSALFFILAAAFGFVYATRRVLWAAIVTYVMVVLGFLPLLAMSSRPEIGGILVLFAIALPFFIIYFRAPDEKWWALIPAGIMGTAGLMAAIALLLGLPGNGIDARIPNTIMFFGIALTFSVIWLRHHKRWALLVIVLSLFLAVTNGGIMGEIQKYWPVLVVLAGFYLLYNSLQPRKA